MSKQDLNELKRLFPDIPDGYGALNFDFSVYFPYEDAHITSFDVALIDSSFPKKFPFAWFKKDVESRFFPDAVLDHRFPNRNWFTVSRKVENKSCKFGYPIIAPINDINKYHAFIIRFNIDRWENEDGMCMGFPVNINLTEDRPYAMLELCMRMDNSDHGIGLQFATLSDDGMSLHQYVAGSPIYEISPEYANVTTLSGDASWTYSTFAAFFSPEIVIGANLFDCPLSLHDYD